MAGIQGWPDEVVALELTEHIPVGTYAMQVAPDGTPRFTFLSKRWLEMLHLDRETVQADPYAGFRLVHPEEYESFVALNLECFANKQPFFWEGRVVIAGETRYLRAESVPRDREDGSTVWEGVMTDITAQRVAEQALLASEHRLGRILEHLPTAGAVAELAAPGRVLILNQQFVRTFGYTLEDLPTVEEWYRRAYPDRELRARYVHAWREDLNRAIPERGPLATREYQVTCKDGSVRFVLIGALPLEETLVVTFSDITARKQAEAERERLIAQLQHALEEIHTLRGMLPLCSHCKSVRDDQGSWHRVDSYLSRHSAVKITHGICPDCIQSLYPDLAADAAGT